MYVSEYSEKVHKLFVFLKKVKVAVTAKDIQTNADVEIVNPDHVIATIDDDKANI